MTQRRYRTVRYANMQPGDEWDNGEIVQRVEIDPHDPRFCTVHLRDRYGTLSIRGGVDDTEKVFSSVRPMMMTEARDDEAVS